jgi:glucokinase
MTVLALDIGGTKIAAAAFTRQGDELVRIVEPLAGRGGSAVGALATDLLHRAREDVAARGRSIDAVAAIIPGIWYESRGRAWAPNIPGWDDYPLLAELEAAAGGGVPVRVDSDRAGYILGETWQGAARGCRDAIFLAVGTGIGAGILAGGEVLRGARDIAGAVGWVTTTGEHRAGYAECGAFEYNASGSGLVKVARDRLAASDRPSALRQYAADLDTAHIFDAADAGDDVATGIVDDAIRWWGRVTANLVSTFDPEIVVFGGGVFGPAAKYIDRIREEAARWAQPISMPQVRLVVSSLGGNAGLIGAGHLALRALDNAATVQVLHDA